MRQDNMLAMTLAGGRGTRLYALTKRITKPAVYYGGKYRVIDFPLSNCVNSNVSAVRVLTQHESVLLNSYAAVGRRWGLGAKDSGVYVLPPHEKGGAAFDIYRGTADVISQNINLIDSHNPEYVLILSGDYIYKMDYPKMLSHHKACDADITIAVLLVPMKEASRLGIINTDETDCIMEFEEEPEHPKSNLASMGIYIFNWKQLRKMLVADMGDPNSNHDLGKDIIPAMPAKNKCLYVRKFKGYWEDVGTVDSPWEANMDLLSKNNELDLNDSNRRIYTEDVATVPHYIEPNGKVDNAYINQGRVIDGEINNSVLFTNVEVPKNAKVNDSALLPDVEVDKGAAIHRAIVMQGVKTDADAVVGDPSNKEIELISKRVRGE